MSIKAISFDYENHFHGIMHVNNTDVNVGNNEGDLAPYDMMYGALSACLYATFLNISQKMKLTFDRANLIVSGEKRETSPTTLKWVNVKFTIHNPSNKIKFTKSVEISTKHCSVYQTFKQVAKMSFEIEYTD